MLKEAHDWRTATTLENVLALSPLFSYCSFQFINCKDNIVAIKMAKYALELKHAVLWENTFPLWIQEIAQSQGGVVAPV